MTFLAALHFYGIPANNRLRGLAQLLFASSSFDRFTAAMIMKFGMIATMTVALALRAVLDTAAWEIQRTADTRVAQASPDATGDASILQGIGLTASHKQIIYDNLAGERTQSPSGDPQLAVGSTIPDSLMLNEMPIAVKDQVGPLRDFKFVKLAGDNILIVDPASRKVVDIITKQEAGR